MATTIKTSDKTELREAAKTMIEKWDGTKPLTLRFDKGQSDFRLLAYISGDEPPL